MILAVASGKGGTGKTTVALGLALCAGRPVRLLDCDVEEPNCHLFLKPEIRHRESVTLPVPVVDEAKCGGCGKCSRLCQFNAIAVLRGKAVVFPELCRGCGGCAKVCPVHAIREVEREIGFVEHGARNGVQLVSGNLNVGQPQATVVIRAVKRYAEGPVLSIVDCPPGASCSMVVTVRDADHVLLVTEPTPFGLHDLKLAVDAVRELNRSFSVVINRAGSGDNRVRDYCRAEGIPVRLEIAEDRRIAEAYSRGEPVLAAVPEVRRDFRTLLVSLAGYPDCEYAGGCDHATHSTDW